MVITAFNPETENLEKSYLGSAISAAVTTCELKNNNSFAANDRIMIGAMGAEATEIVTVSSVNANGTSIVHGATVFSHATDDPVTKLRFDQVKFYRASSSTGSYSVIATSNLDVDNEELKTFYDDTAGTSSNYYKISFYNSVSTVESSLSDAIQGSGYSRTQVGYIIDQLLQEVSDPAEVHVNRAEIIGWFNDVNDDLQVSVAKPYDFLRTRTTLSTTTDTNYVNFPTDATTGAQTMWKFDRIDYNFNDSTTSPVTNITYTLKVMGEEEFRNTYQDGTLDSTTETDEPLFITLDTAMNRFRYWPPTLTSTSAAFYLYYWKYFDTIDSEGDSLETPTPRIYKLYAKGAYYRKRSITDPGLASTADRFEAQYQLEKAKYKGLDRIDAGTPRSFRPQTDTIKGFRRG